MTDKSPHARAHSPEYALLGFLYQAPNHGYNLHQQLAAELGQVWHISQSQTYSILKRLETQGWLSSSILEQEKLPPRQILQITPAGRKRFQAWLRTPSGSSVRAIRLEFISRLYFARQLFPQLLPSIFSDQQAELKQALKKLQELLAAVPASQTFNRLGLELRILQLNSICEWLVECRRSIGINE
jgi:PadR family transcriptional regulator, regulatory protein AphA